MKRKRHLLLFPLLAAPLLALPSAIKAFSEEAAIPFSIKDEYDFNSTFIVPKLEKDGIVYSATIEFPSGDTFALSEIVLNESGIYKLHYSAYDNGKYYNEEYSFLVRSPFVQFDGNKSFSSYGQNELTYDKKGLYVSLAEGETMTFNAPIDLSKGQNLISWFAAPTNLKSLDFSELYITLTDRFDENNAISIRVNASNEGVGAPWSYVAAKANNQQFTGYEANFKQLHVNDGYGCSTIHSFYGDYKSYTDDKGSHPLEKYNAGDLYIDLRYNYQTKELFQGSSIVADFDNPSFYSNLWEGFSSNLVTLSIYAKGYSSSSANFVVLDLLGQDISQTKIKDVTAPIINVAAPKEIPNAQVGSSYPVYEATANDAQDGACEVETHVYYNYGTDRQTNIQIENDRFFAKWDGTYSIVYEAIDRSGNRAQKIINVATTTIEPLKISLIAPLNESKVGETYFFPEYEVTGGSGEKTVSFEVYLNNERIESSADSFLPKTIGNYKILAKAQDILLNEGEANYNLTVLANPTPVLRDGINLPKYFINDAVYELPEAYCYDYSSGTEEKVLLDVTVNDDYGEYNLKSGSSFVPKTALSQGKIALTYHHKDLSYKKEITVIRPYVLSGGIERFNIENYFVGDNATVEVGDVNFGVHAKKKGAMSIEFVNPVLAEECSALVVTDPTASDFSSLSCSFVDSINEEEKISIRLLKATNGDLTYQLDSRAYLTSTNIVGKATDLSFSYSDGKFSFNGINLDGRYYDNGETFTGFSSGKIRFVISLANASKGAGFYWNRIDNQSLAYASSDYSAPRFLISGDYGGSYAIGETANINRVDVSDVLDPNSICYLSVKDPDGEIAKDTDGVLLDSVYADRQYRLNLSKSGQYIVTYTASDSSEQKSSFDYAINVEEPKVPLIRLLEEPSPTINLGEYIRIPEFEIVGENASDFDTAIYIDSPSGETYLIDPSYNAFKPNTRGIYTLRIRAMDKAGNLAYLSRQIEVL